MVRRRYVGTRILQEGMIIDQVIMDRTGRILIARKTMLDQFLIDAIKKMGVPGIYIREGEEEPETPEELVITPAVQETINKFKVADRAKVELSESVRTRVGQGIQYIFSETSSPNFTSTAENVTSSLLDAILESDAVALNIDALKVSDEYTFKHSVDVATIAMIIAKKANMPEEDIRKIGVAGLLHDVGKSMIPNEVLNKAGKLTEEEFQIMKKHPLYGYSILIEKNELPPEVLLGVLHHHEKINGRGYPQRLMGEQISPYAKIIAIADVYDALVTERPYKKAFSQQDALEMIMAMTEELDISYMRHFIDSIILYPVDTVVLLSNGERAKVVKNTPHYPLRPKVVGIKSGKVYDLLEDMSCASLTIE